MLIKITNANNDKIELEVNSTHEAKDLLKKELPKWGAMVQAELKNGNYLILKSESGYKIELDGPFTGGYVGEGSNGTVWILENCGFELKDIVHSNEDFVLEKKQR